MRKYLVCLMLFVSVMNVCAQDDREIMKRNIRRFLSQSYVQQQFRLAHVGATYKGVEIERIEDSDDKDYLVKLERKAIFLCIKAVPRIEKILGYELATFSFPCSAVICLSKNSRL